MIVKAIQTLNSRDCGRPKVCTMTQAELGLSYDPDKYVPQDSVVVYVLGVESLLFSTRDESYESLEVAVVTGRILKATGWASRDKAMRKTTAQWVLSLPVMV